MSYKKLKLVCINVINFAAATLIYFIKVRFQCLKTFGQEQITKKET